MSANTQPMEKMSIAAVKGAVRGVLLSDWILVSPPVEEKEGDVEKEVVEKEGEEEEGVVVVVEEEEAPSSNVAVVTTLIGIRKRASSSVTWLPPSFKGGNSTLSLFIALLPPLVGVILGDRTGDNGGVMPLLLPPLMIDGVALWLLFNMDAVEDVLREKEQQEAQEEEEEEEKEQA
jgi:hypothetical protein